MNDIVSTIIAVLLLVLSHYFFENDKDLQGSLRDISLGIFATVLINIIAAARNNKEYLKILFQSYIKPNKAVRISISYLFRIEVDGHFMLVRNHKNPSRGYQPVGGVYKYQKEETTDLFQDLTIDVDNSIPVDDDSRNDLRCVINKRRHLPEFIRWFNSKKNRELDPWREFYEELISEGILTQDDFPYIQYKYRGSIYEGIKPPDKFKYDEFLYADIIQLKAEGSKQVNAIRNLYNNRFTRQDYIFVTSEEIKKGSSEQGQVIIPHSLKILC